MRIIIIISLFYLYGLTAKADNLLPEASILLSSKKETDKLVMMGSTKAKKIVLSSYDKISNSNFEQNFKDINKVNVIKNTLKKCIEKIGPILDINKIDFNDNYVVKKIN